MNWQSDFVSPQHQHYIQQQKQQQQQQRVTPKKLNHPTSSNPPDTTYLPQRLSNLVQLSLPTSSSSSTMSKQNTNHLYTNSSNYNRIIASTGGVSSGVISSPITSNHHTSMSQQQQHAQGQQLVSNNYSQSQNNQMSISNSSHMPQPQPQSSSSVNNTNNKNYPTENSISNFNSNSINSNTSSTSKNLVAQIIELIKHLNIKLIAFDFDCTIVNIHTGGQWIDSPEKLAEFVRPCFRSLLPALLQTPDLYVCVVTYSPQEQLIKEVLKISMKDEHSVNDLVNKIVIKGNTKEFLEQHGIEYCYSNGKQVHLKYCRNFFESANNINSSNKKSNKENLRLNDSNVLLIDDDAQNLKVACDNGHFYYQVYNNMKLMDFYIYLRDQYSILI